MGPKSKTKVYKFASLDHADTSSMTFEELQNYCLQLFDQVQIEKKEAEKYQVERDKLLHYWTYSGDSLREALFDLRDQQLSLEMDEYSMKTRMDRKVQEVRRLKADTSHTVEETLVGRCGELAKEHEITLEKGHQAWMDVQHLKSCLVDGQTLLSEALTDRLYMKQSYCELVSKCLLKQRRFDLVRLRKEVKKQKKVYSMSNSEKFRDEIELKRGIMSAAIKKNNCSLKKLVSSFERILSYNFEKVSDLKDQAESLKKLDIMLSKEYSEASKAFYKSISSHAEGMRTLNQMRTFLYAAGKTERSLVAKKTELNSHQIHTEALSVKRLNSELRVNQLESRLEELTHTVVSYRRIMTEVFRQDADIMSRDLEKSLLELYQQKVRFYALLSPDSKVDIKWETADIGDLTYKTEILGEINQWLGDFKTACLAIVTLYKRLFKIWRIDFDTLGIIPNKQIGMYPATYKGCGIIDISSKW